MIIVNTQQGLANRLRVIESGLSLSNKLDTSLQVIWKINDKMAASFTDLFIIPDEFILISANGYEYARSPLRLAGIKKVVSYIINFIYRIDNVFDTSIVYSHILSNKINVSRLSHKKVYLFSTYEAFYPFHYNFSWLKPVDIIQNKVDEFVVKVNGCYCIGIHIRHTDNLSSIEQSPDIVFEKAIDDEFFKNYNVIFFLATDDECTQVKFVKKYGLKIIINSKRFGRDSIEATQDVVVDLISLSKCKKMYCNYWRTLFLAYYKFHAQKYQTTQY